MTTVEDIERQQRRRRLFFRLFLLMLLALLCVFIGWIISQIGYKELQTSLGLLSSPSASTVNAVIFQPGITAL